MATGTGANERSLLQHLVAGTSAGLLSTLTLHPVDLVKTRFQVERYNAYRSVGHAFRTIVRTEGAAALYQGLTPALLGSGASWGLYFFFYENAKGRRKAAGSTLPTPQQHLLSGCEAGVATVLITNPIWLVKTRLQLQQSAAASLGPDGGAVPRQLRRYDGFADAVRRIAAEEGPLALYRGLTPGLLLVSHGALQFMTYEHLKGLWAADGRERSNAAYLFMAAASKTVAACATYPYQVIKARLQQRRENARGGYRGVFTCAADIWRNDGAHGFYRGFVPNLMRVVPGAAVTFYAYETIISSFSP